MKIDVVELDGSELQEGVPVWKGITRFGPGPDDTESLGGGDVMQALGIASRPYPADENGRAEGIVARGVTGRSACYLGARDTRSATIVGNLRDGDTVLHSTGPQQAAQVQCKEDKRQVVMATKDPAGKTMVCMLDGTTNKFQVVLNGMILEMNGETKTITLSNGQASIIMQGSTIALDGDVILGGTIPDPVNKIVCSPAVGPAPLPAATGSPAVGIPIAASKGVSLAK